VESHSYTDSLVWEEWLRIVRHARNDAASAGDASDFNGVKVKTREVVGFASGLVKKTVGKYAVVYLVYRRLCRDLHAAVAEKQAVKLY
jgi:hypothetical protein